MSLLDLLTSVKYGFIWVSMSLALSMASIRHCIASTKANFLASNKADRPWTCTSSHLGGICVELDTIVDQIRIGVPQNCI